MEAHSVLRSEYEEEEYEEEEYEEEEYEEEECVRRRRLALALAALPRTP